MRSVFTILILLCVVNTYSQVIVTNQSLPDIGDELEYTIFSDFPDTLSYRESGENMEWSFDNFNAVSLMIESYQDISTSILADSFPEANMIVEFGGFESVAERTDSTIAILGVIVNDFTGFGIELNIDLDEPFKLRSTPFELGDTIEDFLEVEGSFSSAIIPGLDSFDIGIPGTTIDSIRFTTEITKREEAIGWGTLNILGQEEEVLQIQEDNSTNTTIEIGVTTFGFFLWLDASDIFGDMGGAFGGNQDVRTYKFLTANNKRSVVEFDERTVVIDTLGTEMTVVDGRTSADFLSSNNNILELDNITISPNPASNYIQVTTEDFTKNSKILILDMQGRNVIVQSNITDTNTVVDISPLSPGTYLLYFESEEGISVRKIMVQ